MHRSNGCSLSPSLLMGSGAGGDWLIRGKEGVDKAAVDRSVDESTNESRSNRFFSCGYIARREVTVKKTKKTKASKVIWSLLNSATIFPDAWPNIYSFMDHIPERFLMPEFHFGPCLWGQLTDRLWFPVFLGTLHQTPVQTEHPLLSFIHTLACPSMDW